MNHVANPPRCRRRREESLIAQRRVNKIRAVKNRSEPPYVVYNLGGVRSSAFTHLEVMIACGIFFMVMFAILALVSNQLRNAQYLRHVEVDAGIVAAQLYKTNRLSEGLDSGDFGDAYKGYSWRTDTHEALPFTNLFQVDIVVTKQGQSEPVDKMSVYVFSPESSSGPFPGRP
jgi:hypothetical protein